MDIRLIYSLFRKKMGIQLRASVGIDPTDAVVQIKVVFSVFMVSLTTFLPSSGRALDGKLP